MLLKALEDTTLLLFQNAVSLSLSEHKSCRESSRLSTRGCCRSSERTTCTFFVTACTDSSRRRRSAKPGSSVVPPLSTTFEKRSRRMSSPHFSIVWNVNSWTPGASRPMSAGWKSTSGHRKRSVQRDSTLLSCTRLLYDIKELLLACVLGMKNYE